MFGGELRAFDWLIPIVLSVAFIAPGIAARNRRGRRRRAAAPPIG